MSRLDAAEPVRGDRLSCDALEIVVVPRAHDLGGFEVRRALPSAERRMVGPFIFFDQMGPADFEPPRGLDVRPHPHIGLATLTYLLDGEIMHRDSLGNELPIRPGELNWMTAGRGIVHSERSPESLRRAGTKLSGIQSWVALAEKDEEREPDFVHHDARELPVVTDRGLAARIIVGTFLGARSSVRTSTPTFYADVTLQDGASCPLDPDYEERAIYPVDGRVEIAGEVFESCRLLVFKPGERITITARGDARFMVLGGAPMESRRYVWWNFVSSSRERIEQAKEDWKTGRFPPVPNDHEFIPLPETKPVTVDYP